MTSTNRKYVPKNRQESETDRLWADYCNKRDDESKLGCAKYALLLILFIGIIAGLWAILH